MSIPCQRIHHKQVVSGKEPTFLSHFISWYISLNRLLSICFMSTVFTLPISAAPEICTTGQKEYSINNRAYAPDYAPGHHGGSSDHLDSSHAKGFRGVTNRNEAGFLASSHVVKFHLQMTTNEWIFEVPGNGVVPRFGFGFDIHPNYDYLNNHQQVY